MNPQEIENIEINVLLDAVFLRYGYDFRHYEYSSIKRRIVHRKNLLNLKNISELIPKIIYDQDYFNQFLFDMSVTVTEMFRNPIFFKTIREKIIPVLKTYPFVNIWHAGCATGEEAYSLAIILKEEGFYDKVQIYATDFNNNSIQIAKNGIYSLDNFKKYTTNYNNTGGKASLSDYYTAKYKSVKLHDSLKKNIIFTHHNLVTDGVFASMHLIICRNVLIYFNNELKNNVLSLFHESLNRSGFLCVGDSESLDFTAYSEKYETPFTNKKIYKKK